MSFQFEAHVKGYPDLDRWVIEHHLISYTGDEYQWTCSFPLMSLGDRPRGHMGLEEGIRQLAVLGDHFLFRDRPTRLRNLDTGEVIYSNILCL